jgi:hypothetical protein
MSKGGGSGEHLHHRHHLHPEDRDTDTPRASVPRPHEDTGQRGRPWVAPRTADWPSTGTKAQWIRNPTGARNSVRVNPFVAAVSELCLGLIASTPGMGLSAGVLHSTDSAARVPIGSPEISAAGARLAPIRKGLHEPS